MPQTPQPVDVRKKQVRAATTIMHRALRAEGDVTLERAAKGYATALSQWRRAVLESVGAPETVLEMRRVA